MPSPKFHAADARKKDVCCPSHYRRRPVRGRLPFRPTGMRILLAVFAALFIVHAHAEKCMARSGERTAALVELYTSEGCSSCPPADRWLSQLGKSYRSEQVVPLALHVDYWDYIGWKDPYAKREFSQRQRKLSQLQRVALVYTPQVLLQGKDFRSWGGAEFERAVARINAQPARASLELEILATLPEALELRAQAKIPDPAQRTDAALYIAAYENRAGTAAGGRGHIGASMQATQLRQKDGVFYFVSYRAKDLMAKVRFISRFYGEGEEITPSRVSQDDDIAQFIARIERNDEAFQRSLSRSKVKQLKN